MHLAPIPPGHDAILGLASYPNGFATGWRRFVGSLRQTKYAGHVIMGVHPDIPPEEWDYPDAPSPSSMGYRMPGGRTPSASNARRH